MKTTTINVSRSELLGKLRMVGRITIAGKGNPVMGWFSIKTNGDNTFTVTGTDLNGTMSARVDCISVEGETSLCVDAKQLTGVVTEIPEQPITLRITDKSVTVEYFGGYFEIPHYNTDEFPQPIQEEKVVKLPISAETVFTGISQVVECAGNDELRPTMNSVFIELKGATLSFVATNAQVLSLRDTAYLGGEEVSAIVPVKAARLLLNVLSMAQNGAEIELQLSDKRVAVEMDGFVLSYRLTEGRYPNYRSVIPQNDKSVEVGVKELAAAIRRVSVLASKETSMMTMYFDENGETLTVEAGNKEDATFSKEELQVSADFACLIIGLKTNYTLLLLDAITTEKCRLTFSTPERAMIITPVGVEGVVMLQMPMIVGS